MLLFLHESIALIFVKAEAGEAFCSLLMKSACAKFINTWDSGLIVLEFNGALKATPVNFLSTATAA